MKKLSYPGKFPSTNTDRICFLIPIAKIKKEAIYTSPFSARLVAVVKAIGYRSSNLQLFTQHFQQATHPRAHHAPAESVPAHPTSPGHDDVAVHLGGKAEISATFFG